jgi:hypothetical protein
VENSSLGSGWAPFTPGSSRTARPQHCAALVWIFGLLTASWPRWPRGLVDARARRRFLILPLFVLVVGAVATNVIGRRVLMREAGWAMRCSRDD